jgi:hypothetical protein
MFVWKSAYYIAFDGSKDIVELAFLPFKLYISINFAAYLTAS